MTEARELSTREACSTNHVVARIDCRFIPGDQRPEGPIMVAEFVFACCSFYWLNYEAHDVEQARSVAKSLRQQVVGQTIFFVEAEDGSIAPAVVAPDDNDQE